MRAAALRQISVTTSAEAEDAVTALLEELTGQPASTYTDMETNATAVSVYCARRFGWSPAQRVKLAAGLEEIRSCGLALGSGKIIVRTLRRKDWAESWKRHFKPIEIGKALLIKPISAAWRPEINRPVNINSQARW